ncbi:MAG: sigma 54-interacting transcriptional regulator [Acidobacteriaceae bacterium]|nr:sigma 54-interacting transcriptional regulator [Acidobacteriaceae bacterium]
MNARLVGIAGPLKGRSLVLNGEEVSIGRTSSNHLWVEDSSLSPHHCLIAIGSEEVIIKDLQSQTGTRVNDRVIEHHALQHQDHIGIGNSTLVFVSGDDAADRNPIQLEGKLKDDDVVARLDAEDGLYLHGDGNARRNERLARDLGILLKIATGIAGIRDEEGLQWQLLGMLFDVVPAERACILLFDDAGELTKSAAWDRLSGPGTPVHINRALLDRVVRERSGALVNDSQKAVAASGAGFPTSAICVPVLVLRKVAGVIYLDSRSTSAGFDRGHLEVITGVAGIAGLALDNIRHMQRLQEENRELQLQVSVNHEMVGGSARMRAVYDFIRRVATTDSTVLLQGESGTGKELVARAIHASSSRAHGPFVAINCAAITESLLESELFGHEKGAFTGATTQKKGKLEIAHGGTLFLDEVSEFAPALQAKLLRVLQEREFERVGGTRALKIDIRLIAATNRTLLSTVESGTFRRDLYYRLNVVAITLPPLRERKEDIPHLAEHFMVKASRRCRVRPKAISPEANACLVSYSWPGNVRELEHAIERALVLGVGESILPEDLPEEIAEATSLSPSSPAKYQTAVKDQKKAVIQRSLQQCNGNYVEAAKILGLHPNSLLRLIRNLGLKEPSS